MWQLDNQTPFAAERSWVRDRDGAEVWIVAVKAAFAIGPEGTLALAPEQVEVTHVPEYHGEPGLSSLKYEADLLPAGPTTDVLLLGRAYAPGGKPARQVDATMRVGDVAKTVRVFGDRRWQPGILGPSLSDPEPFDAMPIVYERAFGGEDLASDNPKKRGAERRNPVGAGFAVESDRLIGRPAANVEDPRAPISSWSQRHAPAGFGPIAGTWSPRVERAGTYDARWERERLPLLPEDFRERYYQAAPDDQQTAAPLRGGEEVELINLTPSGRLAFRLPRVALGFATDFGDEVVTHRGRLARVILEPDLGRLLMLWQANLTCHAKVLKLRETVITRKMVLNAPADAAFDEEDTGE